MNESIPELQEEFAEIIPTVQEGTIIAGVQSINGKAGDLDLKTINNTDLLTAGNLNLATSDQLSDLETIVEGKQDQLSDAQLAAVNSGIDSTKVAQITTNKNNITTINGKIPAQATSTNKLADKNFVNSSIATNTANYISNNGQPFTSVAQLEAYTGTVTNNDYAFVTGTDSAGNTYYDRYKATVVGSTVTWAKEYRLNNSSFTSDQWTAINSGATTGLIEQITTNQNDIATLQTDKQDKLVAGTNIQIASDGKTISATDTKYTAGTGLTLTGTQFSVTEPVPAGFFTDTASTQEGEGTQFTLNNTTDAPIDGVELKGDTSQETLTGKNKLGYDYASVKALNAGSSRTWDDNLKTMVYNGVTYKLNDDGTVLVTGTASGNSFLVLKNPVSGLVSSTEYIMNGCPTGGSASTYSLRLYTGGSYALDGGAGHQFTYDSQDIVRVNISGGTALPTGGLLFKPMIRLASVADDTYEPYVGGIPSPNPDYPQPVQTVTGSQTVSVVGNNLFQYSSISALRCTYTDTNGKIVCTATGNNPSITATVKQIPAGTYTCSGSLSGVTASPRDLNNVSLGVNFSSLPKTITTTATMGYITFYSTATTGQTFTIDLSDFQIETGSTTHAYQPYESQSYTIDLGIIELAKIGDYQDYIWKDGADWKVHKATAKVTLDGTENWVQLVASGFNNYYLESMATNLYLGDTATYLSNYFTGIPTNDRYSDGTFFINNSGRGVFTYNAITSKDDFKTWLTTHNTGVYYVLATATDTVITDAALIAQLEALAGSTTYAPQTNYATAGTGTNLPVILTVDVFKNNYAGLLARLEKAGA